MTDDQKTRIEVLLQAWMTIVIMPAIGIGAWLYMLYMRLTQGVEIEAHWIAGALAIAGIHYPLQALAKRDSSK